MVDGYPDEDTKNEVVEFTIQGGGPVATALAALGRLGVRTIFMGVVSDDPAGDEIKRGLAEEGVDTRGLKVKKGGTSQVAFIVVNRKTATRTIFWKRPTCGELTPRDIRTSLIKGKDFLLIDGLMVDASMEALRIARDHGVPIMLDGGRLRPGMMELARMCDYVVCSEEFAREAGGTPEMAIKRLRSRDTKAVTVTLGRRGSVTWYGGGFFRTPAFKVDAVDTTGAGDVFHGGYIYGLLRGWDMERTVRFASAFAALKCRRLGGRSGIPGLKEVVRFMEEMSTQSLSFRN